MNGKLRLLRLAAAALAGGLSHGAASAQVQVNSGEVLTQADLEAGAFMGQMFTLGAGTTFEINDGGAMGPVGLFQFPPDPSVPFDFAGSTVNINSGGFFLSDPSDTVNDDRSVVLNAEVNVLAGGSIGDPLTMQGGAFGVGPGGALLVNGGSVPSGVSLFGGGTLSLLTGSTGSVFIGNGCQAELAGGSAGFVFAGDGGMATISDATVTNFRASETGTVLMTGGSAGHVCNAEFGGTVVISGGSVASLIVESGSHLTFSDGMIGALVVENIGSTGEISGGTIGNGSLVDNQAIVTMTGGAIGNGMSCYNDAVFEITGGTVGNDFRNGSRVDIRGGSFGPGFNMLLFTTMNLYVLEASIDGAPVNLTEGVPMTITQRGGALLEVTLEDGSFLDFELNFGPNPPFTPGVDFFDDFSFLNLIRVAPPAICDGDANGDKIVDFEDINHALVNWLDPFNFDDITETIAHWLETCE